MILNFHNVKYVVITVLLLLVSCQPEFYPINYTGKIKSRKYYLIQINLDKSIEIIGKQKSIFNKSDKIISNTSIDTNGNIWTQKCKNNKQNGWLIMYDIYGNPYKKLRMKNGKFREIYSPAFF